MLTLLGQRIAGISYLGDFRMTFGENPKKVRNIVDGNFDAFREIYRGKINVRQSLRLIVVHLNVILTVRSLSVLDRPHRT